MASKDVTETTRKVRKAGWTVSRTGKGHLRYENPTNGVAVTGSLTPSDHRNRANAESLLRKAGWDPDAPDPARERRREKARQEAEQARLATDILVCLQGAIKGLTADDVASLTGRCVTDVEPALRALLRKHPEVSVERGLFAWDPPASALETWRHRRAQGPRRFERVSCGDGHYVLQDEFGELWVATPMESIDLRPQ